MKSIVKKIFREYEKDRLKSQNLLEDRKEEIYKKIPRIKEIDQLINNTGLSIVKQILNKEEHKNILIKDIEDETSQLIKEKLYLLINYGYPETYLNPVYKCELCQDTGYIKTNKCKCYNQKLINEYYSLSNLSKTLEKENFDTFDLRLYSEEYNKTMKKSPNDNMKDIFRKCLDFANNFDKKYDNLLFYGETGLGKTFLCNCIAKELLDKGKTVLYLTASELFKIFEDYRFNRDELEEPNKMIRIVYDVDLLIIDDLGTEVSTIITTSALYDIINSRILVNKPIIVSTNLEPRAFEGIFSDRLTSRFFGHFQIMKFFGSDIRIAKKYGIEQ